MQKIVINSRRNKITILVELKDSNISVFNMMVKMNKPSRKTGSVICIQLIIFQLKCDGVNQHTLHINIIFTLSFVFTVTENEEKARSGARLTEIKQSLSKCFVLYSYLENSNLIKQETVRSLKLREF